MSVLKVLNCFTSLFCNCLTGETNSLHISSLAFETTDEGLRAAFPDCINGRVITDRETGRSRG